MTMRNGTSTTMVCDIFGDAIQQQTGAAPYQQFNPTGYQTPGPAPVYQPSYNTMQVPPQPVFNQFAQGSMGNQAQHGGFAMPGMPNMHSLNQSNPFGNVGGFLHQRRGNQGAVLATVTAITVALSAIGAALWWHPTPPGTTPSQIQTNTGVKPADSTTTTTTNTPPPMTQEQLNIAMREKLEKSTVYLRTYGVNQWGQEVELSIGTGVVTDKGLVLTDFHCVEGGTRVTVGTLDNKQLLNAKVIASDAAHDKALLYVEGLDAPAMPVSNKEVVKGMQAFSLGNTMGEVGAFSTGNVSIPYDSQGHVLVSMPGKYKGDSGGAVVNKDGEIIGIVEKGLMNERDEPIDGLFRATSVRDLQPLLSWWEQNKSSYQPYPTSRYIQ